MESNELSALVTITLTEHKALDIRPLDVSHLTDITDYMIICTATSNRHAKSLADKVTRACKDSKVSLHSITGVSDGQWILLDFCDIVVHIMLKDTREFYCLEKLWAITLDKRQTSA